MMVYFHWFMLALIPVVLIGWGGMKLDSWDGHQRIAGAILFSVGSLIVALTALQGLEP